jgi:hypothetical protein
MKTLNLNGRFYISTGAVSGDQAEYEEVDVVAGLNGCHIVWLGRKLWIAK